MVKLFGMSPQEICWFIGNLMNCPLNEANMAYLENDGMFSKLTIDIWGAAGKKWGRAGESGRPQNGPRTVEIGLS